MSYEDTILQALESKPNLYNFQYNKVLNERDDISDEDDVKNMLGYYTQVEVEETVCGHRCTDWELLWVWNYDGADSDYRHYERTGNYPQCQRYSYVEDKWLHLSKIKTLCLLTSDVEDKWLHLSEIKILCPLTCVVTDQPYNRVKNKNLKKLTLAELKECCKLLGIKIPEDLYYPNWKSSWIELIDDFLSEWD